MSAFANCPIHPKFFGDFEEDCGCSSGNIGSFGFGTLNNANFIGLRYIYQNFNSKDGIFENSPISKESFNIYEVWAQIPITKSFYVTANVPYKSLAKTSVRGNESVNGIGDVSVLGWYKYTFRKKKEGENSHLTLQEEPSGHYLQFGLGVKLPSGKFNQRLIGGSNQGFQVGTGSLDGVFSLGYNYIKSKLGVRNTFSYYLKGENKDSYQFGNQFSFNSTLFKVIAREKFNIMPFAGFSGDFFGLIKQYGEQLKDTNGYSVNASLGVEVAVKKIIFGTTYTLPIKQQLFKDKVQLKQQFSIYMNFVL